jgi:large subunit ribosomal protein L24
MGIRKGDTVMVISGRDRGKSGKVLVVHPDKRKAIVEGVNVIKRHSKANPNKGQQAGIVQREAPILLDKLMIVDPRSGKPTRIGHKFVTGAGGDGERKKVRVARRSGTELDS